VNVTIGPGIFEGGFQIGCLLLDEMAAAGRLTEVSVAFLKAVITQKYVTWLNVCNSKSVTNFESFRVTDEYSYVQV
jgi:hypothetical protein